MENSELPVFEPDKPKGYYSGFRILEKNGYFYAQEKGILWGWNTIKFRGSHFDLTEPGHPNLSRTILYGHYEFEHFEHAKWLIDWQLTPKTQPTEKAHYL